MAALEPSVANMASPFQQRSRSGLMMVGAVAVVVLAGAAVFALLPKKGSLVVTVSGPGNKSVDKVEVLVDGDQKCGNSPCRISDLPVGTHLVKVVAAGYQPTADQAIKIVRGEEAVHNVALARTSEGTGVRVAAEGAGLKLVVDGKDIGPLPQELKDLSPGEHTLRIDGSDRYEPFEKKVQIEADRMVSIEPKLKVIKGLATIKPGENAEEARVLLVSGSERRPLPSLPIKVDISVDKPYSIVATKKGFADYEAKIEFEDGQAERTFVVSLSPPSTAAATPAPAAAAPKETPSAPAPAAPRASTPAFLPKPAAGGDEAPAAKPAATGNGTLNISSNPPSNVILDGKPLGSTPKAGISVSPGSHTVMFVHPEHGRKAKTVTVEAGKSATASVKFP
jgi:serine/threonine-protein kinase